MDIIYIRDLKEDTVIGLYDWERRIRQTIRLDLDLGVDICQAAASDSIADTLDYKAVAKRLIEFAEQSEFLLVETLADTGSKAEAKEGMDHAHSALSGLGLAEGIPGFLVELGHAEVPEGTRAADAVRFQPFRLGRGTPHERSYKCSVANNEASPQVNPLRERPSLGRAASETFASPRERLQT